MAISKRAIHTQWWRDWRKWSPPSSAVVGNECWQARWKCYRKWKTEPPRNPLPRPLPKIKLSFKRHMELSVHCSTTITIKGHRAWKMSIERWIDEEIVSLPWYYSVIKTEIMPAVSTSLDLDINLPSEVTQTEKGKYHTASPTHGIENPHKLNYFTKEEARLPDLENKPMLTTGKRQAEEKIRKFALTSTHKYTYTYIDIFLK